MQVTFGAAIVPCAALLLVAGCSGGPASTSSSGVLPLSAAHTLPRSTQSDTVANSRSGLGLAADLRGSALGSRETSPGWLSQAALRPGPKLYVSDDGANALYIYNATNPTTPIGTITNGISSPVGNFVDANENLYVTNLGGNSVTVYPRGKTAPSKTYTTGLTEPTSIVVGDDGTVYVSEYPTSAIVEYAPNKMTPLRTLSVKSVQGVALDSSNNLYATYTNPNSGLGGVEKFKPNGSVGSDLGIQLGNPGDVKLDRANDVIVEDQKSDTINFYRPGLKQPYGSISTRETPFKLALNATEKLLYVATGVNYLYVFDAMPNGKPVDVLTSGLQSTSGVSLNPPPPLSK